MESDKKMVHRLTESEIQSRRTATEKVLIALRQNPEWTQLIIGAVLYGSMARGDANTGSDIDVAILIREGNHYHPLTSQQLKIHINKIQDEQACGELRINPLAVLEKDFNNPTDPRILNPDLLKKIKNEGIRIV